MMTSSITQCQGELLLNEVLAPYTSWHVGGPAKQLYKPADLADLARFLKSLSADEHLTWIGLGSNLLIRDGGINGTVIYTQGKLKELKLLSDGTVYAEAGVTCAKLAKFCAKEAFTDAAFFAGIPGTVGGALAMNAGAFGGETWPHVVAVDIINKRGEIQRRTPDEFKIAYREVNRSQDEWFVAGYFKFNKGDLAASQQAIKELLHTRNEKQPIGEFSCGSVFRNPPNNYAAKLIEACGLKGHKIGGAWVSTKHANFIINGGEAKAADIETLIQFVQQQVADKFQIKLIPECHIIGEHLNK